MFRSLKLLTVLSLLLCVTACASIVKGTTQNVMVDTPGVPGATCELSSEGIGKETVTTPDSVKLKRRRQDIDVTCRKICYIDARASVDSKVEPWTFGNILFGGLIGLGVDAGTGAWNKYEAPVHVPMQANPLCQAPALQTSAAPTNSVVLQQPGTIFSTTTSTQSAAPAQNSVLPMQR